MNSESVGEWPIKAVENNATAGLYGNSYNDDPPRDPLRLVAKPLATFKEQYQDQSFEKPPKSIPVESNPPENLISSRTLT